MLSLRLSCLSWSRLFRAVNWLSDSGIRRVDMFWTGSKRWPLVISGWNEIPAARSVSAAPVGDIPPDAVDELSVAAQRWRAAADSLEHIYDAQPEEIEPGTFESGAQMNIRLAVEIASVARSSFNAYLLEGSRKRRLVWVGYLNNDLVVIEGAVDDELAHAAHASRKKAVALSSWVQHTDSTIIDRLAIAPSSAIFGTPESSMRMQRLTSLYRTNLNDAAVLTDCVNLLFFHIEQLEQHLSSTQYGSEELIGDFVSSVKRPLGALRNELRAAAELAEALAALVTRARCLAPQHRQIMA
jgi:hypothetical protein